MGSEADYHYGCYSEVVFFPALPHIVIHYSETGRSGY